MEGWPFKAHHPPKVNKEELQNKARKTELFNQIQILKQGKGHMCDSQPIQRKQGKLQKFIKASQMAIEKEGNEPIQYKY